MKKIFILGLVVLFLSLGVISCGGDDDDSGNVTYSAAKGMADYSTLSTVTGKTVSNNNTLVISDDSLSVIMGKIPGFSWDITNLTLSGIDTELNTNAYLTDADKTAIKNSLNSKGFVAAAKDVDASQGGWYLIKKN